MTELRPAADVYLEAKAANETCLQIPRYTCAVAVIEADRRALVDAIVAILREEAYRRRNSYPDYHAADLIAQRFGGTL